MSTELMLYLEGQNDAEALQHMAWTTRQGPFLAVLAC